MSDIKRLLDDPIAPMAPELADLLRSADADAPRAPSKLQDEIISSIVAGRGTTTVLAPARPALLGNAGLAGLLRAWKWSLPLAGLAIATSVVVMSSTGARTHEASPSADTAPPPVVAANEPAKTTTLPEPSPTFSSPASASPASSLRVEDLPNAENKAKRAPAASASAAPKPSTSAAQDATATIDGEIAAIDAARASLAAGRSSEALSKVQSYRRSFPAPHFAGEADALEIQALAALGRTDEARQKADRFLASRPQSPYAQRVRQAVGLKD
ncbi:hypothetical protein AKJ09_07245 [Labilithrix luteola]|uniref:Uncharacterized protein n=1 Tax=Labilithrix luteola TaxID=1391654 RepID=A0A0K1Q4I9_9BACT|nr:hypothetical protein [Labilithrix luteola]AKV00582.1 hypothetical protein AKJ09_07245 [Labilithrix luteola]